jgi:hypothetical protein
MKIFKYFLVVLFLTSISYAQNVKITDFDIPVSDARQLFLNGFYNWSQSTSLTDTTVPKNVQSDFRVDATFTQFYTSPAYAWNVGLNGGIFGRREDTTRYTYTFNADLSRYFSTSKGFFANGAINSTYTRQREFGDNNRPVINVFGGVGYGRMVDATALAKAIRVDQELRKSGVTTKFMPRATMLELARIIDREDQYRDRYKQVYEARMIRDISKVVEKSGVLRGTAVDALGYFRIRSVLFSNFIGSVNYNITNPRFYGGDVRVGASYQVLTRSETIKSPKPNLEIRGRYGYPIGLDHQVLFSLNARSAFDSTFAKVFEGEAAADYWFNMTNRIVFNAGYRAQLVRQFETVFINNQFVTRSDDFSTTLEISLIILAS